MRSLTRFTQHNSTARRIFQPVAVYNRTSVAPTIRFNIRKFNTFVQHYASVATPTNYDLEVMEKKIALFEQQHDSLVANNQSPLRLQSLRLELLQMYLQANQLESAEHLVKTQLLPQTISTYGENHTQVAKMLYTLAHIQFFNKKPTDSLDTLYDVVRIRQEILNSGVEEMLQQVDEASLAFHYVLFMATIFRDIPLSDSERNKLYNVYVGNVLKKNKNVDSPPQLDLKEPLHKVALLFPERSRFKLAQTILTGKLEKVEKSILSSLETNQQHYHWKYVIAYRLANLYQLEMRYRKSHELYKVALEASQKYYGADSVETYEVMANMALLLTKYGENDEECIELSKKAIVGLNELRDKYPQVEHNIARALIALGAAKVGEHPKEALKLANQAMKICERVDEQLEWFYAAYLFAEAYDVLAETDNHAMPLATKMYDEIEEALITNPTPSLLRLPLKSKPEYEEMLGDQMIDIASRTYYPSALAIHYINVACRYVAFYMDTETATVYMERALAMLDTEQSDDHFCLEREFAATQLASFYVVLQQDDKMEKIKQVALTRLKRILGVNHPFYLDQEKHFDNLKNMIEASGKSLDERLAKMEELMQNPEFEQKMNEVMSRMEKRAKELEHDVRSRELQELTEERLSELLSDKSKLDEVMGFEVPAKDFVPMNGKGWNNNNSNTEISNKKKQSIKHNKKKSNK
jgi:tetratricopeptide (TPR) repeat protein